MDLYFFFFSLLVRSKVLKISISYIFYGWVVYWVFFLRRFGYRVLFMS